MIHDLPEFVDLVLQVPDRRVALLDLLLQELDSLVAESKGLGPLVQQLLQIAYGIHAFFFTTVLDFERALFLFNFVSMYCLRVT